MSIGTGENPNILVWCARMCDHNEMYVNVCSLTLYHTEYFDCTINRFQKLAVYFVNMPAFSTKNSLFAIK